MASYQRIALFVIFDSIEHDLITNVRQLVPAPSDQLLTTDETARAQDRIKRRGRDALYNTADAFDLLQGLDLGDKYSVLMRSKPVLSLGDAAYFDTLKRHFDRAVPVRNDVMHGRPLTVDDYSIGFAFANQLLKTPRYWPKLTTSLKNINEQPERLLHNVPTVIDDDPSEVLNNLPRVEYDDTGFVPRPKLEADLKRKILGRHPVVTVLGEGGNGKSALTLQTAYRLLNSDDHNFDAIIWISAKSSILTSREIIRIEAIADSLGIFEHIAEFEPGREDSLIRVKRLLAENNVLLIIDNLETVLDTRIRKFSEDIPGQSKVVFTSRVPLGSDLSVIVTEFTPSESTQYLHRLINAYSIHSLESMEADRLQFYIKRLNYKPLLIKWFALGVLSGLSPSAIIRSPDIALRFCLENVISKLDEESKLVALVFAHVSGSHTPLVVEHLIDLSAEVVERSIAKLLQFSLIEDDSKQSFERTYTMGTFARSYLTRIEKSKPDAARKIIERSRKITASYQTELGAAAVNRYFGEHYTGRSHSETIAASQLRRAFRLATRGDVDGALQVVDQLKISSPEYFEIYRVSAGIHAKGNDTPGAVSDYETAIDVDPEQPQLYFWYAGFLMRYLDDFDGASRMFTKALDLDPSSGAVLREAARNEFFAGRFDKAQQLVDRALKLEQKSFRDHVIFSDLQAQIYVRTAYTLAQAGDFIGAITKLEELQQFIEHLDQGYIDSTFRDHIEKVRRYSAPILIQRAPDNVKCRTQLFLSWLDKLLPTFEQGARENNDVIDPSSPEADKIYIGQLKQRGQQPTFGFLVTEDSVEIFVHRSSVPSDIWMLLKSGGYVRFRVTTDNSGRSTATDLEQL